MHAREDDGLVLEHGGGCREGRARAVRRSARNATSINLRCAHVIIRATCAPAAPLTRHTGYHGSGSSGGFVSTGEYAGTFIPTKYDRCILCMHSVCTLCAHGMVPPGQGITTVTRSPSSSARRVVVVPRHDLHHHARVVSLRAVFRVWSGKAAGARRGACNG